MTELIITGKKIKKEAYSNNCPHTKAFISVKNAKKYFGEHPDYVSSTASKEIIEKNNEEWKKYNRQYVSTVKAHLEDVLAEKKIKYEKIAFSKTCGCSCGCSPGFKITGTKEPLSIWIDLEAV
jgi:hypothetical protein